MMVWARVGTYSAGGSRARSNRRRDRRRSAGCRRRRAGSRRAGGAGVGVVAAVSEAALAARGAVIGRRTAPPGRRAAVTEGGSRAGQLDGGAAGSVLADAGRRNGRTSRRGRGRLGARRLGGCHSFTRRSAVPVGLWVAQAFADGDALVSLGLEHLEHEARQILGGLLVDVVADLEELVGGGVAGGDAVGEDVLCDLDFLGDCVEVVGGVEIEVGDDVTEVFQVLFASGGSSAAGVRRTHVCLRSHCLISKGISKEVGGTPYGEFLEDVPQSHLVVYHLVHSLLVCNGAEILVGPSVRGDLMSFGIHAGDDCGPGSRSIINGAL